MFHQQEHADKELIVVVEGTPDPALSSGDAIVVEAAPGMSLGAKTELGCTKSTGTVLHKFDDDDYYAPGFLTRAVKEIERGMDLTWWQPHLIYFPLASPMRLLVRDGCVGGSFVFHRSLWERVGFRNRERGIDAAFAKDALSPDDQGIKSPTVATRIFDSPELFVYVRHGRNHWKKIPSWGTSGPIEIDVDQMLMGTSRVYDGTNPLTAEDLDFYREVSRAA
jgi:hypothetical protein